MMRYFPLLLFVISLMCITDLYATHNRAGEITYRQLDDLSIEATITTYTRTSSTSADRDSLTLFWGDGDSTVVIRANGNGFELDNDIKRNVYIATHTYPTRGSYLLTVTDPNRIAGILNIDFPNSVNIPFFLQTRFTLLEPRFQGSNSSAQLLQPPIDQACLGQRYTYNPNAFDIDGDSLAYELVTPLAQGGEEVPNYILPSEVGPAPENMISLNETTGEFTWESPQIAGEYNITYLIKEYREGFLINEIIRDMQILVRVCPDENQPPVIESLEEVCLVLGDTLYLNFLSYDPDGDVVAIDVSGGILSDADGPVVSTAVVDSTVVGLMTWVPSCRHVAEQPYQIVIRSTDAPSRPNSALATLHTIRIKVVAPPPTISSVSLDNQGAVIEWEAPYLCEDFENFRGFSIWRSIGVKSIEVDSCNVGLGPAYERIILNDFESIDGLYRAVDIEVEPGQIYCYLVIAEYGDVTSAGNVYNGVASLPSKKLCVQTTDLPLLITKVSVASTDLAQGAIDVSWLLPSTADLDSIDLRLPIERILRGNTVSQGQPTDLLLSSSLTTLDTQRVVEDFIHTGLSTITDDYHYEYRLNPEGRAYTSLTASSVYAISESGDERVSLRWTANVPWENYVYRIYEVDQDGMRTFIDSTTDQNFTITSLTNGEEVCLQVESVGSYFIQDIPSPLVNYSNEVCATPRDTDPPCLPTSLSLSTVCDRDDFNSDETFVTEISLLLNQSLCDISSDASFYRLYFSSAADPEEDILIAELDLAETSYFHNLTESISGCYSISIVDLSGNESDRSALVCAEDCPSYILPNTFTPNDDGANDLFVPRTNRFIQQVVFEVYNRWGTNVFTTNDPMINWDGRNNAGSDLAEGTYYYVCNYFEHEDGLATEIAGTIQLLR